MNLFLLNILLAVIWMFLWGWVNAYSFVGGFVLGYIVLGLGSRAMQLPRNYATRGLDLLRFGLFFVRILIVSNLQVAREVLTPGFSMTPRMIRYDVSGLTPVQITTLANAISLTPGTLSVDLSDNARWLYIHAMYAADRDDAIRGIDQLRDNLLNWVFR